MAVGIYTVEGDYSHYVAYLSNTVLAIVGTASKGPLNEAVAVTSTRDLVNKFGTLIEGYYGLYAAQYFLSQASKLYFVRVAGKSVKAAGADLPGLDADKRTGKSISIELLSQGTTGNGYSVTVVKNTKGYDLVVKNASKYTVEIIKDILVEDLIVGYTSEYIKVTAVSEGLVDLTETTVTLSKGNNGTEDITASDYITGIKKLYAETLDMNLLVTPGISDISVVQAGISLAESRGDLLYIIDTPKGLTRDQAINWVDGGGSYPHAMLQSSYATVYYDWLTIYDSVNKVNTAVPPSVAVPATYAYNDRVANVYYAPAGLNRGLVRGAINTVSVLNKADMELLYDHNINSIYSNSQVGLVLWGQKTLQRINTALDRVNVRRLLIYLKKIIAAACESLVFEPNDRITWNSFEMRVTPILDSIKNNRGIYEYSIVKGESSVTNLDIDNYRMPCMVMVRPTKTAEEIPIYFTITSTGADFNDVLESNGIVVR